MKQFKWRIMLIAFLVSLAVIFSGATLYERYYKENPLEEELAGIEAVEKVEIDHSRRDVHAEIYPVYTENIPQLINEIEDILYEHVTKEYSFYVHDNRNKNLESFAGDVKPSLYEGARKGNYRSVKETVVSIADEYSLMQSHFMVDNSYIYLQAKDGDNYLFIFIPHLHEEKEGGIE